MFLHKKYIRPDTIAQTDIWTRWFLFTPKILFAGDINTFSLYGYISPAQGCEPLSHEFYNLDSSYPRDCSNQNGNNYSFQEEVNM